MRFYSVQSCFLSNGLVEDPSLYPHIDDLLNNRGGELWVSLDSENVDI